MVIRQKNIIKKLGRLLSRAAVELSRAANVRFQERRPPSREETCFAA
jgi:hypothetical protein